ncbi:rho guanine nucleotide exchange factor 7-like isoform X1 [Penaeus chinensis]|uniref:rho guanine nucleotide exchange factor 7-like isoform X1 n=1 Tax=Penaeus chinensis TaxID=139456 RepID=UPI001FB7AE06|nr:rho guanine nucleotide exchange factor 7-like isoform X1 [Penaeus chinensis]
MSSENGILLVEALYSFKGKNNDELCFRKGDIITVTQREEGGWWEGTLDDKTGWFPSNYTKEHKPPEWQNTQEKLNTLVEDFIEDGGSISPLHGDSDLISPQHSQQQQIYRNLVLKDILESERTHVADLQNLHATHLTALHKSELLSEAEYKQLVGNLEEVIATHTNLVTCLEEQSERPSRDQRIGGAFLTMAPQLQGVHKTYCTNHPRAVCILEKYKDELNSFMECQGAFKPGIMVLTTALSKPFRRLDKYAGMLQEYERHLDEGHPDRGDTQRSSHVYKELASTCGAIRRQKELELEVVTGRVHGWEGGDSLGTLGEVVRMGSVALLPDHRDRYLVLFPATLVMLSVSPRMSAFIFEGNYPLSSIQVTKLEDGEHYKNAFEVSGPIADRIVAVCQTKEDQHLWVDTLTQQCRMARASNFTPHKSSLTSPPVPPAHSTSLVPRQSSVTSITSNTESPSRMQRCAGGKVWSMSCLRPSPPLRPGLSPRDEKRSQRHTKRKDDKWHEDDALILRVIEAYCTSAKTRYTVNSTLLDSPQVLIAEEEKIIIEETHGNQVVMEEKSLVDTVYALKDQVAALLRDYQALKKAFELEQQSSRNLRNILKQHILPGRDDIKWDIEA